MMISMQRLLIFGILVTSAHCLAPLYTHSDEERIPFSYIVKLKDHVQLASQQTIKSTLLDMHSTHKITYEYKVVLNGFAANLTIEGVKLLQAHPDVEYVQEDGWAHILQACSVQHNPPNWGLNRVSTRGCPVSGRNQYDYHMSSGAGVRAFIIDTGIRITHNDLEGRAGFGINLVFGEPDSDQHGHGTHVAGIVCSATYGVAKKATCIAVKVLSQNGHGVWSAVIMGIDWVAVNGTPNKDVANFSLSGGKNQAVDDATNRLVQIGIFIAVGAGNSRANACNFSPSGAALAFSVAATNQNVEGTSNDSLPSWSNFGRCVKIFAPGASILSIYNKSDDDTAIMSGTSMSSPHVCGIAALINGAGNGMPPATVTTIIQNEGSAGCIADLDPESPNLVAFSSFQCTS